MAEAPRNRWVAAASGGVASNIVAGFLTYVATLSVTWVASRSSSLFAGLFPAVWAFLNSPVAIPAGLLLVGVGFVAMNLLVFLLLYRLRPGMSRAKATSLSGVVVVLLVAGLSMAVYLLRDREPPRARDFRHLTSAGNVVHAAVSPDGKFFVYAADHGDGRQSLRLGQTDEPAASLQIAEPAGVHYGGLAFSPEGTRIFFTRYECDGAAGALYQMPALGGEPLKIKDGLPRFFGFALSPDGRSVAFVRNLPETAESVLVTAATSPPGEERRVARLKTDARFIGVPAWSPDGESLTCALRTDEGRVRLVRYKAASGEEDSAGDLGWEFVTQVSSLPGGGGLILSASKIYGPFQIWRVPYPGGRPEQVTHEVNNYDGMSLTADHGALVTVEDALSNAVWVVPAGQPAAAQVVRDSGGKQNDYWGFSWMPDGRVLYVSAADGRQNIWVMNADGTGRRRLTHEGDNVDPCAPDDDHVVFTSKREGHYNIWKMNADGSGKPVRLTRGERDFAPHCSADGTVVYTSEHNGQWTVWRVGLDGSAPPTPLTTRPSQWPAVSRDGKVAFFYVDDDDALKLGVLFPGGGPVKPYPLPCTASTWAELRWSRDGKELAYVDTRNGVSNIWTLPLGGGPARQLTQFTEGRIFRYDWSADGRLVLSRGSVRRDVVRINFGDGKGGAGG